MKAFIRVIIGILMLGAGAQCFAAGLYVICNPALNLSSAEIKNIFLGDEQFAGSVKLEPTEDAAAQTVFLAKAIGMDKEKYDAAWVKKSFRDGLSQPASRAGDAEVIEFVKKTPGAVGYVLTTPPADVKVVQAY